MNDMQRILLSAATVFVSIIGLAQSANERIATAMNTSDWLALDSIYNATPHDSIDSFLDVFSRALIGNRLNRPDVAIPAFEELLNDYSAGLDLSNLLNSSVLFAMDLSKVGNNAKAAAVVASVLEATKQHLDSAAIAGMQQYIDRYTALTDFTPYSVSFSESQGVIPFDIVAVGNPDKGSMLMQLADCRINDKQANITFDTGAGVNIISDSLARDYGLIFLNAYQSIHGIATRKAQQAIAKELRIGNIIIRDVPFLVVDLTLDNEEANKYTDDFSIIVGSELMLRLNDLTIDFAKRQITVPSTAPTRSGERPNMFFSPQMHMVTNGEIHNQKMQVCIDTGDASYGALNGDFFERNKEHVLKNATTDTVRTAGIGGVKIQKCYRLPRVAARIADGTVTIPNMVINTEDNALASDYECNLGLKSLMLFEKIRFNLVDFTITTYPTEISAFTSPIQKAPTFKLATKKKSAWQTAATVGLSVANGLLNTNAPTAPDL